MVLQKAAWFHLGLLGPVQQQQPDPGWLWAGPLISATHPSTPNTVNIVWGDTTIYQPGLHVEEELNYCYTCATCKSITDLWLTSNPKASRQ